ncbi:CBO0543 family protein [Bacillus sp. OTU530]|uniref:CBO0543 family protein n=1 Tax=Bacillus sp. OTU530 TaxID=3043862 RepID=UPI00406CC28D
MLHTIISYLRLILPFLFLIGAWRFGDWKNWRKYYPTIVFYISVDFSISVLTYEYPLWLFHKSLLIPNHTITDFFMTFTAFPSVILLYLSRYPYTSRWSWQVSYVTLWVIFFTTVESVFKFAKLISYHNSWNFWWSVTVWAFMFVVLRLHHTKPLCAWLIYFICIVFLITYFDFPISKLK